MLDFITCVAVAFWVAGLGCLLALVFDKVLRRGVKDQPDPSLSCLKIPADCPRDEFDRNFIVDLECPDGTVARLAIPLDSNSGEGRCSRVSDSNQEPVGLNLVCSGHYN